VEEVSREIRAPWNVIAHILLEYRTMLRKNEVVPHFNYLIQLADLFTLKLKQTSFMEDGVQVRSTVTGSSLLSACLKLVEPSVLAGQGVTSREEKNLLILLAQDTLKALLFLRRIEKCVADDILPLNPPTTTSPDQDSSLEPVPTLGRIVMTADYFFPVVTREQNLDIYTNAASKDYKGDDIGVAVAKGHVSDKIKMKNLTDTKLKYTRKLTRAERLRIRNIERGVREHKNAYTHVLKKNVIITLKSKICIPKGFLLTDELLYAECYPPVTEKQWIVHEWLYHFHDDAPKNIADGVFSQQARECLWRYLSTSIWSCKGIRGVDLIDMYGYSNEGDSRSSIMKRGGGTDKVTTHIFSGEQFSREALRRACWGDAVFAEVKLPEGRYRKYTRPLEDWEKDKIISTRLFAGDPDLQVMEVVKAEGVIVYSEAHKSSRKRIATYGFKELIHVEKRIPNRRWIKCAKGWVEETSRDKSIKYLKPFTMTDAQRRAVLKRTHYTHIVHRKMKIKIVVGERQTVSCEIPPGLLLNDDIYKLAYIEEKEWVLLHYCFCLHHLEKEYLDTLLELYIEQTPELQKFGTWEYWWKMGRIGLEFGSTYGLTASGGERPPQYQVLRKIERGNMGNLNFKPRDSAFYDANRIKSEQKKAEVEEEVAKKASPKVAPVAAMVSKNNIRKLSADEIDRIHAFAHRGSGAKAHVSHVVSSEIQVSYEGRSATLITGVLLDERKREAFRRVFPRLESDEAVHEAWLVHEFGYLTHAYAKEYVDGVVPEEAMEEKVEEWLSAQLWEAKFDLGLAADYGVDAIATDRIIEFKRGDRVCIVFGSQKSADYVGLTGVVSRIASNGKFQMAMVDLEAGIGKKKFPFSALQALDAENAADRKHRNGVVNPEKKEDEKKAESEREGGAVEAAKGEPQDEVKGENSEQREENDPKEATTEDVKGLKAQTKVEGKVEMQNAISISEDRSEGALRRLDKISIKQHEITCVCPVFGHASCMAGGTTKGSVILWIREEKKGMEAGLMELNLHSEAVTSITQMHTQLILAVGFSDGLIRTLDISAKKPKVIKSFRPYSKPISNLTYSYKGKRIVCSCQASLSVHKKSTGKELVQVSVNPSIDRDDLITDIKMVSSELIAASTSTGFIHVIRFYEGSGKTELHHHQSIGVYIRSMVVEPYKIADEEAWPQPIPVKSGNCNLHLLCDALTSTTTTSNAKTMVISVPVKSIAKKKAVSEAGEGAGKGSTLLLTGMSTLTLRQPMLVGKKIFCIAGKGVMTWGIGVDGFEDRNTFECNDEVIEHMVFDKKSLITVEKESSLISCWDAVLDG